MMTLFDDEQIMRTYLKNAANTNAYEADKATAERIHQTAKSEPRTKEFTDTSICGRKFF